MVFDQTNVEQLLHYALQERNTEAVLHLNTFMKDVPETAPIVMQQLTEWLKTEPDAVYFFVRTVLAQAFDETWLPLLHDAAQASLQIAVNQSESESIIEWLRLIAREPTSYQLNDILREGIRLAQIRAHQDGKLGNRLLSFTLKRACDLALPMVIDQSFVEALGAPIGTAITTFNADAIAQTIELGRDVGLLVLAHALRSAPTHPSAANVFTPDIITYLWQLSRDEDGIGYLLSDLRPSTLIHHLVDAGVAWLNDDSIQTLLSHTIDTDDELFIRLCYQLTHHDHAQLVSQLTTLYSSSLYPPDVIIRSLTHLQEATILSPQEITPIVYQLGTLYEWKNTRGKIILEYLGRLFQQYPTVQLPLDGLRKLNKLASELRQETTQKIFLKRIQSVLDTQIDEAPPLDFIIELQETMAWNNNLQNQLLGWWRNYALNQPLTRLQLMEKALDNKRALEPLRNIIQTTIAIRKFLGKRTLSEIATMVNATFTLLQLLSDSFDPVNNKPIDFDVTTLQMELTNRANELTAQERSVFAKDLRELADLITTMAECRSKSTLIRREDDIERQLMSGEQDPQSAIDTMRWLAGFLGRMPL